MSTAKSMAALYLNSKRNAAGQQATRSSTLTLAGNQQRFKSSASNLASASQTGGGSISSLRGANKSARTKSTSMTNLIASDSQNLNHQEGRSGQNQLGITSGSRIQRPASRNALDSIHNGMNAKYAQVQSKVYLQNIKPTASKIPSSATPVHSASSPAPQQLKRPAHVTARAGQTATPASSRVAALAAERAQFEARVQELEEELRGTSEAREKEREELERERQERAAEVDRLKIEIQNRAAEQERQNEEYHQKLLEAYELADQNRRATDSVLSESRQRDEEARKKAEELESQLAELREFVAMKEEMTGKMFELREQIREERERYEQQLKSLRQLFDNEKISSVRLDENSNYFNRLKPNLESCESINKQSAGPETTSAPRSPNRGTGCRQCQSGSTRQLHKSEQDIYGSKMSTRMQDSAKSAWRASKQFASSVITGGVVLSTCRQCTKRKSSPSPPPSATFGANAQQMLPPHPVSRCNSGRRAITSGEQQEQHTSVIQVGAGEQNQQNLPTSDSLEIVRGAAGSIQLGSDLAHKEPASLIRVDQNNKLTIVTKFNDSNNNNTIDSSSTLISSSGSNSSCAPTSGSVQSPSGSGSGSSSERSRCESSSSGRGTGSDAGSAASQNGDSIDASASAGSGATPPSSTHQKVRGAEKRHKRRSSLFKASKMFGGSQTSLGKLRSFFSSSSASSMKIEQIEQQPSVDHLESSRIRCLELNQALQVGSLSLGLAPNELGKNADNDVEETSQQQIATTNNTNRNDHLFSQALVAADKRQQVGQGNSRGTPLQPPPQRSEDDADEEEQVAATDKQQQRAGSSVIAASA